MGGIVIDILMDTGKWERRIVEYGLEKLRYGDTISLTDNCNADPTLRVRMTFVEDTENVSFPIGEHWKSGRVQ